MFYTSTPKVRYYSIIFPRFNENNHFDDFFIKNIVILMIFDFVIWDYTIFKLMFKFPSHLFYIVI